MKPATVATLLDAAASRRSVVFAKRLSDGAEYILPDPSADPALNELGIAVLATGKTGTHIIADEPWFIEARHPAPRLAIVGAVHIAQSLAPVAAMAGFAVIVIDPRTSFGSPSRFPTADQIINDWPDGALDSLRLDDTTAVVVLTHDPKLDDPALACALRSGAFYIGALGSRKSHAKRLERLESLGFAAAELQRIHGPVGLRIGAVSAGEIAISIISEIIAVRRNGDLGKRA
jgi:xanthine dehydrogenase accessory factor